MAESPCLSPSPSPTVRAAQIQRKYRRMRVSSPIYATTRRKLLAKFVPAPAVLVPSLTPTFQLIENNYPDLNVEHSDVQEWIVVSRYLLCIAQSESLSLGVISLIGK